MLAVDLMKQINACLKVTRTECFGSVSAEKLLPRSEIPPLHPRNFDVLL